MKAKVKATLDQCAWSATELLVAKLAETVGQTPRGVATVTSAAALSTSPAQVAAALQLDLRHISSRDGEAGWALARAAPVIVEADSRYWLLLRANAKHAQLLDSAGDQHQVALAEIEQLLRHSAETRSANVALASGASHAGALTQMLEPTLGSLTQPVVSAITRQRSQDDSFRIAVGWALQPPQATLSIARRLLWQGLARLTLVHFGFLGLWVCSWLALSQAIQQVDHQSYNLLWVVLLGSAFLVLPLASWLQQRWTLALGTGLRQALLQQALALQRGELGQLGLGELMAKALEANNLDAKACQASATVLFAVLDLILVLGLIALAQTSFGFGLLFCVTTGLVIALVRRITKVHGQWYPAKLQISALQTEEMVGHRARKTLQGRGQWYVAQDKLLAGYHRLTAQLARLVWVLQLLPKLWLLLALACIMHVAYLEQSTLLEGGSLLLLAATIIAVPAWQGIADSILPLLDVRQVLQSNQAVGAPDAARAPTNSQVPANLAADLPLHVSGLHYRYPGAKRQLLVDINFQLAPGSRTLLRGASGGGKSTLAALLSGRLTPDAGAVLSGGLDRYVVGGKHWRHQVAYVPQAHTNHVIAETFAFNLLFGVNWPPTRQDLAKAEQIVVELGLSDLLHAMPAGMNQVIGDNGWRLSAGERARLFLARGLLQNPGLLIVDEVLAPLDPQTAHQVLDCLQHRAHKLMLIAHA